MGTTKAEAPELKPCPLCGSTNLFLRDRGGWEIDCAECELNLVVSSNPSREGVIAAWNNRAADPAPAGECAWTCYVDTDSTAWNTECGRAFELNEGGPVDNHMKFCCYCGKTVIEDKQEMYHDDDE